MTLPSKKDLSERDICTKYITPAIQSAGWDIQTQVREEVYFTDGRIYVKGNLTSRGKGKRAQKERDPIKDKINEELNRRKETRTESKEHSEQLTDAQKIQERTAILLADNTSLKPDDAKIIAEETIDYKVDLLTDGWPGNLFLARKPVANASIGIINRDTAFYDKFWTHLETSEDQRGFEALQIVMMALIRAEDELQVLMTDKEALETFREKWSAYIDQLLKVTD